jgi:hypothetical protein
LEKSSEREKLERKVSNNDGEISKVKTLLKLRANRYVTASLASITVIIFYYLQSITSWLGLSLSEVRGHSKYIDQASILNSAKCFKLYGIDVYEIESVPKGCGGFQHSTELLRFLNITNLSDLGTEKLGNFFMWLTVLTLCSIFFLIKRFGKSENLIALIALVSPGIWLLLERGNYDEVIFCLVAIGGFFVTSRYQFLGMFLITITVLINFYTLPAFLIAALYLRNRTLRRICLVSSVPLSLYSMFLISRVEALPSNWRISFGLESIGLYLELAIDYFINSKVTFSTFIVMIPGLLLLAVIYRFMTRIEITASLYTIDGKRNQTSTLYTIILMVFLSCYFSGMSFDYRLIFLATLLGLSPLVFRENRFKAVMVVSGLFSLYFSTFSYGLRGIPAAGIQVLGDIAVAVFVATQLIYLRQNFVNEELSRATFAAEIKTIWCK